MWLYLKNEFYYNKTLNIFAAAIILFAVFIEFLDNNSHADQGLSTIRAMVLIMFLVTMVVQATRFSFEKKERYYTVAPVANYVMAISRLAYMMMIWGSFVILFLIYPYLKNDPNFVNHLIEMLSLTGFMLIINSLPFIQRDLSFYFEKSYQKTIVLILYLLGDIIIGIFVMILYFYETYSKFFKPYVVDIKKLLIVKSSIEGALMVVFMGFVFSLVSIASYQLRKIHLE